MESNTYDKQIANIFTSRDEAYFERCFFASVASRLSNIQTLRI